MAVWKKLILSILTSIIHHIMREIKDINEIRNIQLSILDDIHTFCQTHNIRYSLAFGSLLGAVRHGGYIPWDDDIDICMPRADYERFLQSYRNRGVYQLRDRSITSEHYYTFAKIVDGRTMVSEPDVSGHTTGVWVDVFPIDYVPDGQRSRRCLFWFKNVLYKMRMCKLLPGTSLHSAFATFCYRFFPLSAPCVDRLLRILICRTTPTSTMSCLTENIRTPRNCFPAVVFDNIKEYSFEGRTFMGVVDADAYLTCHYGNYMQLPPEDQRTTHHFQAWWI